MLAEDVRHILRSHGDETREISRGQLPITSDDVRMLPTVVREFDSVEAAPSHHPDRPAVRYTKRVNGTIYYVEEYIEPSPNGKMPGRLRGATMWKTPAPSERARGYECSAG